MTKELLISHPIPECFHNPELKLIIFGGKGGVGKTTMAATAALHLAQTYYRDRKVLVISTDPAHSLSDSFDIPGGNQVTPVPPEDKIRKPKPDIDQAGCGPRKVDDGNLYIHELDAARLTNEFKRKNEAVIKKLADRGTYFDQGDIAEFFELSLPGMDEVMAIIEIANLLKDGSYDLLILDTAPTGHTLRMLALPKRMEGWIRVMGLMQHKHRYMAAHFTGKKYAKDACDIFLDKLSSDIEGVKKLLSNRKVTRFVAVMIPEPMSIHETESLMNSLSKMSIPMKEIIINRVAEATNCPFCTARKEDQRRSLAEIENLFSQYTLIKVPVFPGEIRGVAELNGLADYFLNIRKTFTKQKYISVTEAPQAFLALDPGLEFILFGGKGGVGKTSLASAAALHLARLQPQKKILVFSTDPAHSLSDAFKLSIGAKVSAIEYKPATNLFALEINSDKLFENFKHEFKKEMEALFDSFLGGGIDIKFDREVMTELFALAPPGLDEIMALERIMDLRKKKDFDIFVLDTAPTGHLLRFLEIPDIARQWLRSFFRLLLKYKGVVRLAGAAERALTMSKNIRKIQEILVNPKLTDFIAVTIPEAMGFLELERLVSALESAAIPCNHIAINMVLPQTECAFCSRKRAWQYEYVKKIHSRFPTRTITKVPLFPHEVRGIDDLTRIGKIIFGNGSQAALACPSASRSQIS